MTRQYRGATYVIEVDNAVGVEKGVASVTVDGQAMAGNVLPVLAEGETARVRVVMG